MAVIQIKYGTYDFTTLEEIERLQNTGGIRLTPITVPGRHGSLITETTPARQPVIVQGGGRVVGTDAENARYLFDTIKNILYNGNQQLYILSDRYRNAYMQGVSEEYARGTAMAVIMFAVTFYCHDPFEYSSSSSVHAENIATGNTMTVAYNGNAIAFPSWTIRPSGGAISAITVTNTSLSTSRNFAYSAQVADGASLIVHAGNYTVTNAGSSDLNNWSGDFLWIQDGNNVIQLDFTTDSGSPVVNLNATYRCRWQ